MGLYVLVWRIAAPAGRGADLGDALRQRLLHGLQRDGACVAARLVVHQDRVTVVSCWRSLPALEAAEQSGTVRGVLASLRSAGDIVGDLVRVVVTPDDD